MSRLAGGGQPGTLRPRRFAPVSRYRPLAAFTARRRARRAETALAREVPVAAELLRMAVTAGFTPYLSLRLVATNATPVLRAAVHDLLGAVDGGTRLATALEDSGRRHPALAGLMAVLAQSERAGSPVGPALARLAAASRAALRREALTRARTLPVRLLFPLVFLVLPAFVLLTVAPVVLAGVPR